MKKTYIPLTINTIPTTRVRKNESEQEKTERLYKMAKRLKVKLDYDNKRN